MLCPASHFCAADNFAVKWQICSQAAWRADPQHLPCCTPVSLSKARLVYVKGSSLSSIYSGDATLELSRFETRSSIEFISHGGRNQLLIQPPGNSWMPCSSVKTTLFSLLLEVCQEPWLSNGPGPSPKFPKSKMRSSHLKAFIAGRWHLKRWHLSFSEIARCVVWPKSLQLELKERL